MNNDVISIIGEFSHIDLHKLKYKCEHCNQNTEEITCCIYYQEQIDNGTFSPEIDFFKKTITYYYVYICQQCYDYEIRDSYEIIFYFKNLLHIESFEQLFEQIINIQKQKINENCIFDNIQVMEFNNHSPEWFKSIFTIFSYHNNKIIENHFLYENDQCLTKYYQGLSNKEQEIFKDYKVSEYLKLIKN